MVNELDIIKVINKNIINDLQFFAEHDNSFFLSGFMYAFNEYNGGVLFKVSGIYLSLPNVNIYSLCLPSNLNFYAYISLEHHPT